MKKFSFSLVLVMFLAALTAPAGATVITFESAYPGSGNIAPIPLGYAGYGWSLNTMVAASDLAPNAVIGTTAATGYGSHGEAEIILSSPGNFFNFTGAYITAALEPSLDVTVEGWRSGTKIYDLLVGTFNDFPHWFDFNFNYIDELRFVPQASGQNAILVDNITTCPPTHPVPLPPGVILLGTGLACIFGRPFIFIRKICKR